MNVSANQVIKMHSETELYAIQSKFMKISRVAQPFLENRNMYAM
jgi:hypothetical protein